MGGGFYVGRLGGVPIYLSPWYFALLAYYGLSAGWESGVRWGACVTVSLLVHELGHAAVARRLNLRPQVMLHGWGGLTRHERADTDRDEAVIIFAGPLAGLLFGAAVYAFAAVAGAWVAGRPLLHAVVLDLLTINLFWSVLNLVPLWPLDGGQLFRLLLLRWLRPARAERVTHGVGLVLGIVGAFAAYYWMGSRFAAVLAGLLALQNIERMGSPRASGAIRSRGRFAQALIDQAQAALTAGDYREAARLGHQLRDTNVSGKELAEVWRILGLATTELGQHDEAVEYLRRAPVTSATLAARARCVLALRDPGAARALLAEQGARLSGAERAQLATLADA